MYPSHRSLGSTLTDCPTLTSTPKKFKLRLHCNNKIRQIMELEKTIATKWRRKNGIERRGYTPKLWQWFHEFRLKLKRQDTFRGFLTYIYTQIIGFFNFPAFLFSFLSFILWIILFYLFALVYEE